MIYRYSGPLSLGGGFLATPQTPVFTSSSRSWLNSSSYLLVSMMDWVEEI
jgi:hypothetical protein